MSQQQPGKMRRSPRIVLAGLFGGLAMMVGNFAVHRPPLDAIGWSNMPNEADVGATLTRTFGKKPALYVYPAIDSEAADQDAARLAHDRAAKIGPSGLLLYRPAGGELDELHSLLQELAKTIVVATAAALLLAKASPGTRYVSRVGFVAAIGAIASLSTNYSYHAWFGYPLSYTLARIFMDLMGWLACSLVISAIMPFRALQSCP